MTREKPNIRFENFLIPSVDGLRVHAKLLQSCPTLCDPVDCRLPGLSIHGNSPGRNTGVGKPCPSPGDLPHPGIDPASLMSPALAGGFFTASTTWETQEY